MSVDSHVVDDRLDDASSNTLSNVDPERITLLHNRSQGAGNRKFQYELMSEFGRDVLLRPWILKGILAKGEGSIWFGPPGSLKSALMAELSLAVASGQDWHGHRNKARCGVVYFALERASLVRRRLVAGWPSSEPVPPIAVVSEVLNLMKRDTIDRMAAIIADAGDAMECPVGLVIVDTFSKGIAAGGGDENSAKDQGVCFGHLEILKGLTAAHIALVGHTGKDEGRGMRGSNASYGDADVMVQISGETVKIATIVKANDLPDGQLFAFKSEAVTIGKDDDGDVVTVNIAVPAESDESYTARKRLSLGIRLIRDAVAEALISAGEQHVVGGDGPSVRAVSVVTAREAHKRLYVSDGEGDRSAAERQAWKRCFDKARELGVIGVEMSDGEGLVWLI